LGPERVRKYGYGIKTPCNVVFTSTVNNHPIQIETGRNDGFQARKVE
jgi:hypothetical protein